MDNEELLYWIWLSNINGIGPITQRKLLGKYGDPYQVYLASEEKLYHSGLSKSQIVAIEQSKNMKSAIKIFNACKINDISITTVAQDTFPLLARDLEDLPIMLYYQGNIIKNWFGEAVIGSRRCSKEGKERTVQLAIDLSDRNIPVISGMAKGIDSYAHTACLKAGGYTVAVLGNGLDVCYPSEHKLLMQRIREQGLLISEYAPGTGPATYRFPQRNRIIAACSERIHITEASRKSGALITADYAKKYGREVDYDSERKNI